MNPDVQAAMDARAARDHARAELNAALLIYAPGISPDEIRAMGFRELAALYREHRKLNARELDGPMTRFSRAESKLIKIRNRVQAGDLGTPRSFKAPRGGTP